MAKELPYFKFEPSEYIAGNIQMCSMEAQGLFINICSLYWIRLGNLPEKMAKQKLFISNANALQELYDESIIKKNEGLISITFLDEQLEEFKGTSEKRRNAANKRWSNTSAMQVHSKSNAIREEKKREEKKKEDKDKDIKARQLAFKNSLWNKFKNDYNAKTLEAFYLYWTEHGDDDKKMRFEKQKSFSVSLRLKNWAKNNFDKTEPTKQFTNNAHLFQA